MRAPLFAMLACKWTGWVSTRSAIKAGRRRRLARAYTAIVTFAERAGKRLNDRPLTEPRYATDHARARAA